MKIAPAMPVNDANFVSSTVPENDYPAWSSKNYALGDRVIRTSTHRIYEAAKALTPSTVAPETSVYDEETNPDGEWIDVSATNRWRVFDPLNSAKTVRAASAQWRVVLDYACNVVSLRNVSALSATVEVRTGGVLQYSETLELVTRDVASWYEYFYQPFQPFENRILRNVPAFIGDEVTVAIEGPQVSCGHIVIGAEIDLGITVEGTQVGMIDFSSKERDVFGNYKIVERLDARTASYQVAIPIRGEGRVIRAIEKSKAKPTLFYLEQDNQERATDCFGTLRNNLEIQLSAAGISFTTIEVEGF